MRDKELILETLKQVADAIVNFWRCHCEVAVHDLTQLDKSLVYIAGDVTKRRTGSPITDLVVKALRKDGDRVQDLLSYRTVAKDGRVLKSSTFFFRGKNGKVIGALCINLDTTEFANAIQFVETFIRTNDGVEQNQRETFASSASETIESLVGQIVGETGKQPFTMSKEERVQFIRTLEGRGVFLIKGAVDHTAAIMGVSKFTIYGYLQKIRAGQAASADSLANL